MTGSDLLNGMSYVDARFVEEAETQPLPKRQAILWKKWASLAACACIFALSAFSFWSMGSPAEKDPAELAAGAHQADSTVRDVTDQAAEEGSLEFSAEKCLEMPSVILRIGSRTDSGFTASVAELVDTDIFQIGMELTVVLEDAVRSSPLQESARENQDYLYGDEALTEGSLVQVQFVSYDEKTATLYADAVTPVD